jgi:glycosyltransferase involved in cell wall biosynthesis
VKLLFVVQRYGKEVAGGAERACREFATRLVARGHQVEVVTSRARSYVDWSDEYPPGTTEIEGVQVHRLSVLAPRDPEVFLQINGRVLDAPLESALVLQREWLRLQGPELAELPGWVADRADSFDAMICFTYLYWPTWAALRAAEDRVPTILHPLAHDEAPLALLLFDEMFHRVDALAFLAPEEASLVEGRFATGKPSTITGVGVDLEPAGVGHRFRAEFGIGDRPYLVFVGRLDPYKGSDELFALFTAYKERQPGPLALVLVGEPVVPIPHHPDVIATGFVDEQTKHDAIAGALALVQPSYYESFSIVLTEAWAQRKPAIVQGRCAVLAGQARRSGGAIPYDGYAEFEAALDLIVGDAALRERLADAGRRFVERHYAWDRVLDTYEAFLRSVVRESRPARISS